MKTMYYSYDPENGIEFHDTAEEAEACARKTVEDAEFYAEDSDWQWVGDEDQICWGEVKGKVTFSNRPLNKEEKAENPEWEFIRAISLDSIS